MKNLKPKTKDRKKFDIDLAYGEVREQQVADMLTNKKIEVKSERDVWQKLETLRLNTNVMVSQAESTLRNQITGFIIYVLAKIHLLQLYLIPRV